MESRHRGAIAVCSPDGRLIASVGDPDTFIYLRSAAKPFQLLPFLASGAAESYGFTPPEVAIMAASHSGEDRHAAVVDGLLRRAGFDVSVLQCGTHTPYDGETADRLLRDHEPLTALRHNCSGKHSGMVLFARAAGWPVETYWDRDHPVQRAVLAAVAAATDVPAESIVLATDGCGVPTFGLSLRGLATAFARLADPAALADEAARTALAWIRDAMMAYPELVAGERRRLDTALMRAVPGRLVAKAGAEGIQAVALLAGTAPAVRASVAGMAVVIEDGDWARRAASVATCAALAQLGVLDGPALEELDAFAAPMIRDPRGEISGEVRPAFEL